MPGKTTQVACLQCFNIQVEYCGVKMQGKKRCHQQEQLSIEIQFILDSFKDVFVEPKGLSPCRLQDHRIILKEGVQVVNCRPYRYGAAQKDIIEGMT